MCSLVLISDLPGAVVKGPSRVLGVLGVEAIRRSDPMVLSLN